MNLRLEELSVLQSRLHQSPAHQRWSGWILKQRATRMLALYRDMGKQSRYSAAVDFLINDLFGPNSLCYRELGLEKAEATMLRVLPAGLLQAVIQAIEFSLLTLQLDLQLAEVLDRSHVPGALLDDMTLHAAMRKTAAAAGYQWQTGLVLEIGAEIELVVHKPFVTMGLKMCRHPARAMGLGELQDYLERGVAAFKKMKGSTEFFRMFEQRELEYLESVFRSV